MDLFAEKIKWHPRFRRFRLDSDSLYLIGENDSYLLNGKSHRILIDQVNGVRTVAEIVYSNPDFIAQALATSTIQDLLDNSILVASSQMIHDSEYGHPNFKDLPDQIYCYNGLEIWNCSGSNRLDGWIETLKLIITSDISAVAIVDDYLDPRLEQINRTNLEKNRSWLIIKPTGEKICVGPFFTPVKSGPCWKCLSSILIRNQPVRKWVSEQQKSSDMAVPILYNTEITKHIRNKLISTISCFELENKNDTIREFAKNSLSYTDHFVRKRPQCPHCGDPQAIEQQARQPLKLKSCLKQYIADGGARSKIPAETVNNLVKLLNPITGAAFGLGKLGNTVGIETYQTLFYKTPLRNTRPENSDFVQVSLGKGISPIQSKASAICESIERYTAQYQGEEPVIVSKPKDLVYRCILPEQLACYSERQYLNFARELQGIKAVKRFYVEQYHQDLALPWSLAWSLSYDEFCYVPFTFCYTNTPYSEERYCRYNSNGNAAGNTLEEALLQGLLELIERDATAIWWYNRIQRPSLSFSVLSPEVLDLINQTLEKKWVYWMLNLTHDFDIPVVAAIAKHKKTGNFRFGFGCHLELPLACQRALTELCQLIAIGHSKSSTFDFDQIKQEPFLFPNQTKPTQSQHPQLNINLDIKEDINICLKKAERLDLEVLVVQTTRPDIPLSTVKVIIPGLCHIWPQLGNKRLYDVPFQLNWTSMKTTETDINPVSLLI